MIEALDGALAYHGEIVSGTQIGQYLQRRVTSYPGSQQTPDFGALDEGRRGELVLRIVAADGLAEECAKVGRCAVPTATRTFPTRGTVATGRRRSPRCAVAITADASWAS